MPRDSTTDRKARLARRIRHSYDRLPYPAADPDKLLHRSWHRIPTPWIQALSQPAQPPPRGILVAGCGTGNEAFVLAKRFPKSKIVAVDFSLRSIEIARRLLRKFPRPKQIRFIQADLTSKYFKRAVRGEFDFVSCHGVLSYIPRPVHALRNLAGSLTAAGVLWLGVNGSAHYSKRWRRGLRALGIDCNQFHDGPELRKILKVCDGLGGERIGWTARETPDYLASDVFGPMISNLPLSDWIRFARRVGLHFLGSSSAHRTLRPILNHDLYHLLIPRTRPEVHELAEQFAPAQFHSLVFATKPVPNPPWRDRAALVRWRVAVTHLYRLSWPASSKTRGSPNPVQRLSIKSKVTNTIGELWVPRWVIEVLRQSKRNLAISEILGGKLPGISSQSLRKHLYLLYLLAAINLNPPE